MSLRVGLTLPQFRDDAEAALEVAGRAEAAGLDGIFVFDHLWPLGRPDRPALHSVALLGALAVETDRVILGTLVARVGLVPDAVLVNQLTTLHRMAGPGRFVAGLGTGDRANRAENRAYGVPFASAAARLAALESCLRRLRAAGVTTWVGGLSPALVEVAAAESDGWNGWGITPARLRAYADRLAGTATEVTWAGQVLVGGDEAELAAKRERYGDRPGLVTATVAGLARHLRALAAAGASWAVCAPLDVGDDTGAPARVAEAAAMARDPGR